MGEARRRGAGGSLSDRSGPHACLPGAWHNAAPPCLSQLKNINWVTTDCYGTLIDWEKGIVDACKKEADKDGFSFEEAPFLDRFMEVQAEIMAGSYELYAEVLRRTIVKVAGELGWEIEPSRAQFLPDSVAYWLPFREANAAMDRLGKRTRSGSSPTSTTNCSGSRGATCAPNSTSSSPRSRSAATSRTRRTSKSARAGSAARKAGSTSAATTRPTSPRC